MTPGPVAVPERVQLAMARAVINHRSPAFLPVLKEVRAGLQQVFQTRRDVVLLACSGTGAMEAAVVNTLPPGSRAVVVRGGKFGERWGELCEAYGVRPEYVDVEWGHAVHPDAVRAAFERVPDAGALLVQASETSTGTYHPIRELAELVHERPGRLILVDGISGVGVHDLPMDEWGIDVLLSGSQKSWLLPPGLAFIALSEAAEALANECPRPRFYFDLRKELKVQRENSTAWTPAVSLIVGLQEALRMILEDGLERVFERHRRFAESTRAAMLALDLKLLSPNSPAYSCTAVHVPEGVDGKAFVRHLRDRYAITVAGGQGELTGKIFRIGHMGDLDAFDVMTAVAAVEMGLADMHYPVKLGEGLRAAQDSLREWLAQGG
jgi:aspartate aminotransferase-like enzyme